MPKDIQVSFASGRVLDKKITAGRMSLFHAENDYSAIYNDCVLLSE